MVHDILFNNAEHDTALLMRCGPHCNMCGSCACALK
jgi:hypothetical protein